MPDAIKYSTSAQTLALKEGNFFIGTGDDLKGDTATSGYWNGITPPTGGYTIYLNKASQGPSIYVASSDAELISLTNKIGSQSFTTATQCLSWYLTQTDKMVMNIDYPVIPTNGITFISDVGSTLSYPKNGNVSYSMDAAGTGGNANYLFGTSYVSEYGGGIQFDGVDDYAFCTPPLNPSAFTFAMIARSVTTTWSNSGGLGLAGGDGSSWIISAFSGQRGVNFYMGTSGSTNQAFGLANPIGTITPTSIVVPHMYVISSNGSNLHKGYIDNGSPISITTNLTRSSVAGNSIQWGTDAFAGARLQMVSYVQILYNRQLSDTEVLSLYNAYQPRFLLGFDADAIAFFTAAGITNTTQQNAVNTLVVDLKAANIWTKMQALYPFVGGSATSHKYNLKDPRDLDAAYRLQFNGGWSHTSNGIQGDGFTAYADTFAAIGSAAIPDRANHWSSYIKNLPSSAKYTGVLDYPGAFAVFGYYSGRFANWFMGLQTAAGTGIACQTGFVNGTVTSSSNAVLYYNGTSIYSTGGVGGITSFVNAYTYYLSAYNSQSPSSYNDQLLSFSSLGNSLTATDAANLYTAVQKFQTSLGRQV